MILILIDREHHKLRGRQERLETAHGFHAVDAGEIDVHDDHLRLVFGNGFDGGLAGAVIAHAAETVRVIHPVHEDFPHPGIVFYNGNCDGHFVLFNHSRLIEAGL